MKILIEIMYTNSLTCNFFFISFNLYYRSPSPRRKRRERSPIPRPTKIHIGHLTRNVTKEHIMEIFSTYGQIKMVDFAMDKLHPNQGRGFAYVEFETADEAENAMKHMDGGKYKISNFFLFIVLLIDTNNLI